MKFWKFRTAGSRSSAIWRKRTADLSGQGREATRWRSLCVHVPNCIWTKALLDGSVKVNGLRRCLRGGGIRSARLEPVARRGRRPVRRRQSRSFRTIYCASPVALKRSLSRCRSSLRAAWCSASSSCGASTNDAERPKRPRHRHGTSAGSHERLSAWPVGRSLWRGAGRMRAGLPPRR